MDDDCLILSEDIKSPSTAKSPKVNPFMKTKQARLPFVRVPAKNRDATPTEPSKTTPTAATGRKESKKRKHSGSAQVVAEQPKTKKRSTVSSVSRKCASPEVEVSSSSDEVITLPEKASEAKSPSASQKSSSSTDKLQKSPLASRTSAFLQKFVKKKPTQQDEVSTSVADASDVNAPLEPNNVSPSNIEEKIISEDNKEGDVESDPSKAQVNSASSEKEKAAGEDEKESHGCKSKDSSKTKAKNKGKRDSILEAIEIAINKRKPSVLICSDDRDAAEKELVNQSKKRKLSNDSGKSPISEKENLAKPPSPKKSKNLLTAFILRGVKSSPESAKGKGANSGVKSDSNSVSSPGASKRETSDDLNETSSEARGEKSEVSIAKNSDLDTSKEEEKSASDTEDNKTGKDGDSSSSSEPHDGTPSKNGSDDEDELAESKSPCIDDKSKKTPVRSSVRCSSRATEDKEGQSSSSETKKLPHKKLTPKALAKLAEKKQREELRLMKHEEKMKQKQEKEEEKAKKEAERIKLKEEKKAEIEKQRKEKEEQKKKKQEELDAKSKEREEKRKKAEEEKRLKEEEKRAKEEEKRVKEEEKKKAEQEEEERKKKVAEKFANFFKAGKEEPSGKTIPVKDHHSGPFQQMQVSRYTALAPIQRSCLTEESRSSLDEYFGASSNGSPARTYLDLLRAGDHKPSSSSSTPPAVVQKDDKDDCVIIEQEADDEDEEEDDLEYAGEDMVVCEKAAVDPKNHKGKLLKFCENRRPAYWGTWTKKPTAVRPRRPFAKEEIFDYEYDSDDDWEEEEENGESLSDSEGEKEDEEDEQYEVDNDFFVPHGYLSDDEGQEDEENLNGSDGARDEAEAKESTGLVDNKEKLKAKQAEFEKELKKQTKQLKPRVLGCLWLHGDEQSSGAAFDHLHRVMSGYSAVVCVPPPDDHVSKGDAEMHTDDAAATAAADKSVADGVRSWYLTFPGIPCVAPPAPQPDLLTTPAVTESSDAPLTSTGANGSQKRKFFKTFPEEAIPSLIRLTHGNRNGQLYIVREFVHYWHKQQQRESAPHDLEPSSVAGTPRLSPHVGLSKKKIKDKLIELASYRRCPDDGPFFNQSMWYVEASVRELHGVKDAALPNEWAYCTTLPRTNRVKEDGSAGDSPACTKATNLISRFTKVLSDEEKAVLIAKKNADVNASGSNIADDNNIQEVKPGPAGDSSDKTPQNGKKSSNSVKKRAKISPKGNPGKISTPNFRKTANSSLKSTPSSSPLLAFFKTPRSTDAKKSDSKSPRIKASKDACPDDQCITLD